MKKVIFGSLLAVGLIAGVAYAHSNQYYGHQGSHMQGGGGYMMPGNFQAMPHGAMFNGACPGYGGYSMDISDERQQQFLDATASLRRQMHEKRFELREAVRNPDVTTGRIAELRQELFNLQAQIQEQAVSVQ